MSDPLYRKELLRLAADAVGAGRLDNPDGSATAYNPACGDRVTMDIRLENGQVAALAHQTRACILAQASAAILGAHGKGLDREALRTLTKVRHRDAVRRRSTQCPISGLRSVRWRGRTQGTAPMCAAAFGSGNDGTGGVRDGQTRRLRDQASASARTTTPPRSQIPAMQHRPAQPISLPGVPD